MKGGGKVQLNAVVYVYGIRVLFLEILLQLCHWGADITNHSLAFISDMQESWYAYCCNYYECRHGAATWWQSRTRLSLTESRRRRGVESTRR